jgi:Flp pilus assembly protein TadG
MTSRPPSARRTSRWLQLIRDTGGGYALIVALALPMLLPAIGIGIDTMRAMALKQDLQQSIDSTAQTMTLRLNLCLDKARTANGTKGQVADPDTGCLNDSVFTGGLKASAQTLLNTNFTQRGYVVPPQIVGDVAIDQITGQMQMQGTVTYKCFFMKLIDPNGCLVAAGSGTKLSNAFAQGKPLSVSVPTDLFDIWAQEPNQPLKPIVMTASDGWKPYTWTAGSNLPLGLALTKTSETTATVSGTPAEIACDTSNCAPQTLPPVAVSVMDNGDANRANMNRQTAVGYLRFRMIHVLKITQVVGVQGEDGQRDQATGTDVRPSVFTYGAEPVVSGGLAPFTFTCSGMPQGTQNNGSGQFTCDSNTGRITGQPLLNAGMPVVQGTYQITVTDARGKTATGAMNYIYRLPTFTAYGGSVSGTYGKNFVMNGVFGADGGYGWVNATCSGLPPGVYCGGQGYDAGVNGGRWGYFEGFVQGQPQSGSPSSGVFYATLTDAAGRSMTVPITYNWTAPTQDQIDYYDCTTNVTNVAYVDAVYSSVHDKYGSGNQKRIFWACGSSADSTGYAPNNFGPGANGGNFLKYGTNYNYQMVSKDAMNALIAQASNVCQQMLSDTLVQFDGRQGDTCVGNPSFADISQMGRVNPVAQNPPPSICYRWKSSDGWGLTKSSVISCTNQDGSGVTMVNW